MLVLVIGFFGWPYIGRIVRGQTLSLREREYVEAARSLGAGRVYILFRELLPNLVAPIIVYTTLMIPTNILTEAALSFLGVGVKPPTASWGEMLSTAVRTYEDDPMFMIIPGLAIFITVLAFNLFGDGVRTRWTRRAPAEPHRAAAPSRCRSGHEHRGTAQGPRLYGGCENRDTQRTSKRRLAAGTAVVLAALLTTAACGGKARRRQGRRRRRPASTPPSTRSPTRPTRRAAR